GSSSMYQALRLDLHHFRPPARRAGYRASGVPDRLKFRRPLSKIMRFTIATYNIHKGFSHLKRRMVIHELRDKLRELDPDIVFLQEVQGVHERHAGRYHDWPVKPQHEFIADEVWHEVAYGKTVVHRYGHHGNAVLSRFPIVAHENHDISAHQFESRGMLHCEIKLGTRGIALHCINVHLGLFERGRQWQIRALCERIRETVPMYAPL